MIAHWRHDTGVTAAASAAPVLVRHHPSTSTGDTLNRSSFLTKLMRSYSYQKVQTFWRYSFLQPRNRDITMIHDVDIPLPGNGHITQMVFLWPRWLNKIVSMANRFRHYGLLRFVHRSFYVNLTTLATKCQVSAARNPNFRAVALPQGSGFHETTLTLNVDSSHR